MTQDEFDTIQKMTTAQLNHRLADSTLNNDTLAVIAAELARREQAAQPEAQPTPGAWQIGYNEALVVAVGPEPCIVADCATDCAVSPERAKANAAFIVRAKKLAADNERLRALVIATATGIREVADLLAPTAPATAASLRHRADAAIEAAKEASK